ncbi:MAG: phosphate/phosphite/phosphonate ABC transporter substrate-binding protein [Burkholderiaceae bacterium]|nr:MAG: phosphate/phosphite/phosphonate ABC transporter substrate-binding protein [Burkholderiaceae bacterium]
MKLRRRLLKSIIFWGLVCSTKTLLAASAIASNSYTLSVVPQYNGVQLHTEWAPLLARISRDTGVQLQLVLAKSIPQFESTVLAGEPDFVYMNPYHAVMAKRAQNYQPLLRDSKALKGILVVRQDSPYKSLQDLEKKVLGFPAPNAFGASLYMRALLTADNVNFQAQYLGTHSNVYRSVLNGSLVAGGGINTTLNDEAPEVRSQLRVLYQTPESAPHPIAVHPRVPAELAKRVREAFLALAKDAEGQKLLAEIRMAQPTAADYQRDYLPLEKLKIEKFVILEKE